MRLNLAWGAFALANAAAMARFERWETVPFHFIWVSLTLVYGLRVWRPEATVAVLAVVTAVTGELILIDVSNGTQAWDELTEVPLMGAMFVAMVWHAQRRQQALETLERVADERASLLDAHDRFLQDASHELRTPVTIARGHLDLIDGDLPEVAVAVDELNRMERILDRLLLLANADQPDFLVREEIDPESFLEDVFLRWSEVAPRVWRLGRLAVGTIEVDPAALRAALDALLENAVKFTGEEMTVELRSHAEADTLVIEVHDTGAGIPPEATGRVFERFSRAEPARGRADGGVGLGLAIVDAIAKAHGGRCGVETGCDGTTFALALPQFRRAEPAAPPREAAAGLFATS